MNHDPNYPNNANPYGAPLPPNEGQNVPPAQPSNPGFSDPFSGVQAPQGNPNSSPFPSPNPYFGSLPPLTPPLEEAVDPQTGKTEETMRVERMRKRIYWLFVGLSIITFALVLWEIIDFIGGYH